MGDCRITIRNIANLIADQHIPDHNIRINGNEYSTYISNPGLFNAFFTNTCTIFATNDRESRLLEPNTREIFVLYKGWDWYTIIHKQEKLRTIKQTIPTIADEKRSTIQTIAHLVSTYNIPDDDMDINGICHTVYIKNPNAFTNFFQQISGRVRIERRESNDTEHEGDELYTTYGYWEWFTKVRRNITRKNTR